MQEVYQMKIRFTIKCYGTNAVHTTFDFPLPGQLPDVLLHVSLHCDGHFSLHKSP